ncbi:MAG: glutamate-1-semialdehyde 2,1-aminomutase, partial [Acidobacteriota bacterium]
MTLTAGPTATLSFAKSDELRERAKRAIPAGAHTYSKGDDQFPERSPGFLVRGKGCRVWDADGNEFLDWGMGLRSTILGHANEEVLAAVRPVIELGANFIRPTPLEVELAEQLIDLIPCAEMVKFAKNGSDVTTAAVKLARAHTGRDIIVRCLDNPFFSVDDWFIGDTVVDAGIPQAVKNLTRNFRYNDLESLRQTLEAHRGNVACVILEPASTVEPQPGFLEGVQALAREHGAVLIFDEIISGFRWHARGAQSYYGVTPDLATFGKAIANGFALAALVGRRDIMELGGLNHDKPRVFLLSTTNGAETHALAAGKATIGILVRDDVPKQLWRTGQALMQGFNEVARDLGVERNAFFTGIACSPYQMFLGRDGKVDLSLRTLYLQEMIRQHILPPYFAISAAHGEREVAQTLEASRNALLVVREALERGTTDG